MNPENKKAICGFSLKEKLYAQISFNGGVLTGAYGLCLVSTGLGVAYLCKLSGNETGNPTTETTRM